MERRMDNRKTVKLARVLLIVFLMLITPATFGCSKDCEDDEEGERRCVSTDLETCKDDEWKSEDCLDDYCSGYSSATCVDHDDGQAYCRCGS